MAVFEVESWTIKEGKEKEHDVEMRRWLNWVRSHRELFPEWKSVRYFEKHVAGGESNRHLLMWEYENLAAYERYKARRKDYTGPYAEYKENDPYYKGVFDHSNMGMEFWKDMQRDLWIE
jgi:hypothetical protein